MSNHWILQNNCWRSRVSLLDRTVRASKFSSQLTSVSKTSYLMWPKIQESIGMISGERAGHKIRPPVPIHIFGNCTFRSFAPLCWKQFCSSGTSYTHNHLISSHYIIINNHNPNINRKFPRRLCTCERR